MENINKLKFGLMALMICGSVTALADDSFEWHGSVRTGGAYNSSLQNVNKTDENHLGTLGNEFDTSIDSELTKTWTTSTGEWAKYHLEFNMTENGTDKTDGDWENEQNYLEIGGIGTMSENANFWMGTRKMNKEITILDLNWQELEGTGFGYVTDKYEVALFSGDSELTSSDQAVTGEVENTTITAQANFGALSTRVIVTKPADFDNVDNDGAVSATVTYGMDSYYGFMAGSSKVIAQLGSGVTSDDLGSNRLSDNEDDTAMRIIADGSFDLAEGINVSPVVVFESTDFDTQDETETGLTVAARVNQKLNNNWGMVYEGALYTVDNADGSDVEGTKYKISAGPSLKLDYDNLEPEMRFVATIIGGDEEVISLNEGEDSEFRVGYEFVTSF